MNTPDDVEQELNEKQGTLGKYTSRAKALFRPRCKNTFELEHETKFRQNEMQPELEPGSNGVKYLRLKALLPKYRKRSFDYNLRLQENKRELEQIQLEMGRIENSIQDKYLKPTTSRDNLEKQDEDLEDHRRLSLNYRHKLNKHENQGEGFSNFVTSVQNQMRPDLGLNETTLESDNPIKCLSVQSDSSTSIKWQEKLRNFMYDISEGLKPRVRGQKYEEMEPLNTPEYKAMTSPKRVRSRQHDFKPHHEEIELKSDILEEDQGDLLRTSLTDLETISLSTNSSKFSIENEQMTISKVILTFLRNSKTFLRSKYNYKKKITLEMSENESEEDTDDPQKSFGELEETVSNARRELETNRALLGLDPISPELLEHACFQKKSSEIDLVCPNLDYAQPSTSKMEDVAEEPKCKEEKIQKDAVNTNKNIFHTQEIDRKTASRRVLPPKQENRVVNYAIKTFQKFWKTNYGHNSFGEVLREEIELEELKQQTKKMIARDENSVQNVKGEEVQNFKEFSSQINGFKETFHLNKSQNRLDQQQQEIKINDIPTSIHRNKGLCSTHTLRKEYEIIAEKHESTEKQNVGDILGELIDILQVMRETSNEMKEIREGLTFHNVKSDRSIKPLKVHRDYRALVEEKLQRKRRQSKKKSFENPDGDGLTSEGTNVTETIAIIHRPPD